MIILTMNKEKTIYNLGLHQETYISNNVTIMRVPGGWIYTDKYEYSGNASVSKCFVPFDDEFMETKGIKPVPPNKKSGTEF